jgi:hypothetical protein
MTDDLPPIPASAPQPGSVWKHYKSSLYRVTRLVRHSETREILVEYVPHELHLHATGTIESRPLPWARPLAMWHEPVEVPLQDGTAVMQPRFRFVGWVAPT